MSGFKNLKVYQMAFDLSIEICKVTLKFPIDKRYGLTSQIRRSSRSVCANMAEAYRKRRYPSHFISKPTDCDMENSETSVWLDYSLACEYITRSQYDDFIQKNDSIGKILNHMIYNPKKFS